MLLCDVASLSLCKIYDIYIKFVDISIYEKNYVGVRCN